MDSIIFSTSGDLEFWFKGKALNKNEAQSRKLEEVCLAVERYLEVFSNYFSSVQDNGVHVIQMHFEKSHYKIQISNDKLAAVVELSSDMLSADLISETLQNMRDIVDALDGGGSRRLSTTWCTSSCALSISVLGASRVTGAIGER